MNEEQKVELKLIHMEEVVSKEVSWLSAWPKLAATAKCWRFEGLTPCGWKQAQTTGGGLSLTEVTPSFQFKGCPGLYFVGETLDCAGSCGGFNLHWAFGSGLAAGRDAAKHLCSRKR